MNELPDAKTISELAAQHTAPSATQKQKETTPIKKPLPAGWWSFQADGMRDAVIKLIQDSDLPDYVKAFLIADIQSQEAKCNVVAVHAHRQSHMGKAVISVSINGKTLAV